MTKQTIAEHCLDQLMRSGPCPLDTLADGVRAAGLTRARNPRNPTKQALNYDPRFLNLTGEIYDATARLLDGSWFTTRVRYRQPGRTRLFVDRELGPLLPILRRSGLPLRAGGKVRYDDGPAPSLIGPDGWLPDVDQGGLVGLRLSSGQLTVVPVEVDEQATADAEARVRELVTRHAHAIGRGLRYRVGEDLGAVLVSALLEAPDLLREPLAPLDEVLDLPYGVGPPDWSRHLLGAGDGVTLQLGGVPPALARELQDRATRMGITVSEYVVLQLGANAWRWQPPCVHDLERQRADAYLMGPVMDREYGERYDAPSDDGSNILHLRRDGSLDYPG